MKALFKKYCSQDSMIISIVSLVVVLIAVMSFLLVVKANFGGSASIQAIFAPPSKEASVMPNVEELKK